MIESITQGNRNMVYFFAMSMAKKPFFSILIPTYNRASDLQFALFCIFQQTYKNFEIVISDNCSTDSTLQIVKKFKDRRIRYSSTKKTIDNASNMKRALSLAKGEYVFFHSDDDFLIDGNALEVIQKKIKKYQPGFIRTNYVSLSQDNKQIFSYKSRVPFAKDTYISYKMDNKTLIDFILRVDPYFITGIIIKNDFPKQIRMIDSDPVPWFEIVFYTTKKNGGLFIVDIFILAKWSRREMSKHTDHHIFTLINGKLRCEPYLEAIKERLSSKEYALFVHNELILLYVIMFPMVKLYTGNKRLLQMSARINRLDSLMKRSFLYWVFFLPSLVLGRQTLLFVRDTYLHFFAKIKGVENEEKYLAQLRVLKDRMRISFL